MRTKKPVTYETTSTHTAAVSGAYTPSETKMAFEMMDKFVHKSELTIVRELISSQSTYLEKQINDLKQSLGSQMSEIKGSLSSREMKFWAINGVLLTVLVAIFIFALPEMYKKDYNEKLNEATKKLSERIDSYHKSGQRVRQ
jgi:cell division protein FtsL